MQLACATLSFFPDKNQLSRLGGLRVTWPDCGCRSPTELSACLKTAADDPDEATGNYLDAAYKNGGFLR